MPSQRFAFMSPALGCHVEVEMAAARIRSVRLVETAASAEPQGDAARSVRDAIVRHLETGAEDLAGLPLDMEALPPFHRRVLEALRDVPAGSTVTYGALAARVGSPGAARAVGDAMRRNPFVLVVPCHRVLAAGGAIGQYSGWGGADTKARLLALERDRWSARAKPRGVAHGGMSPWPPGFERIPDEDWTRAPLESLALHYDTVERHGWYVNLDATVDTLRATLRDGDVMVDYSGGTGILIQRLLDVIDGRSVGMLNVDSSPKFLRLCLEKFRSEERVALRRIRYLKNERRLEHVDEVVGAPLAARGVDVIVSTNAVHLYDDLDGTLASWARLLRPGGLAHVQSGNIGRDAPGSDLWIIDETVHAIHEAARDIARTDERFAPYRATLDDPERMRAYDDLRKRLFLPVRPLDHYVSTLERAGFTVENVTTRPITAHTAEWRDFLAVYVDGILGWVGGAEKVDGRPASKEAQRDRFALLDAAMARVFGGKESFGAEWTYLDCRKP